MATKLTGIDGGMTVTAGDSGTLITDGSLVIGNADTDSITVNAEFISPLVPNQANTFDVGDSDKCWKDLHLGNRLFLHGSNFGIAVAFVDPPTQNVLVTVPAVDGTLAIEGMLPSFLPFGKNGAQSAPVTNFELTTVNGSQNAQGWRMPVDGFITNISCQFDVSNAAATNIFQIALWKNGVEQASQYIIILTDLQNGDNGITHAFDPPLAFTTNDTITLKMTLAKGANGSLRVEDLACLLRILN